MKRNLINEIIAIKSRSENNSRYEITSRLNDIEYSFNENLNYNGEYDKELLKYIPISVVACFEAFFRSVIKELIDSGKPYSENVISFNQSKNVKFDFDIVSAIQTKKVTIGDFISHILPLNNFEDINSDLSILIGNDFTKMIKTFKDESFFESNKDNSILFIENSDQIIKDIKRTFELRNIFCHEFATNIKIDKDEFLRLFKNAKIFLSQTDNFIWFMIDPKAPKTQAEMNDQVSEKYKIIEHELSELIISIKESTKDNSWTPMDIALFDKTIEAWEIYRKTKAEVDASYYNYGTIYPLIFTNSLITTTLEKIESLKNEYSMDLKKMASRL